MKVAPHTAPPLAATTLKTNTHNELNPAKQARAADPEAKGAEFGHLVASFAHAKHAPAPPVLSPPVIDPVEETPATEETPPTGTTEETPPADPTVETPPIAETETATVADPALAVETQLLADLAASIDAEPGDTLDLLA